MGLSHSSERPRYLPTLRFPGYRVGTDGSIWSCRKSGPGDNAREWRKLKPFKDRKGRPRIRLRRAGKYVPVYIHRLVLETFVGPCPAGMECCHENGKPWDNRLENLRWDSHLANMQDKIRHGKTDRGEKNKNNKLTEGEVRDIKRILVNHPEISLAKIGRYFGVHRITISMIKHGKSWSWL